MNYCIFSIDDSRKQYTDAIRSTLDGSFWFRDRGLQAVNANNPTDLYWAQSRHKYKINWQAGDMRVGHLGIWYSVLEAIDWDNCPIVTFEDDAILTGDFVQNFWGITESLPEDTDVFSLFLPRDQDQVFRQKFDDVFVNFNICKAYQVYGGVSMLWTQKGAAKFRRLVQRDGIMDQWDNQLYAYGRAGEMNVYTTPPTADQLVIISGKERSIVQESEVL